MSPTVRDEHTTGCMTEQSCVLAVLEPVENGYLLLTQIKQSQETRSVSWSSHTAVVL